LEPIAILCDAEFEHVGDDVVGLPGAFMESGVRSMLVSIPKAADDATFQFMVSYHDNKRGGKAPITALRETQQAMLAKALLPTVRLRRFYNLQLSMNESNGKVFVCQFAQLVRMPAS
jgi:CHAT domain-containing protein